MLFTIGYGKRTIYELASVLKNQWIRTLVDVRSSPYSKWQPWFNREGFKTFLESQGIEYRYAGKYLGGLDKNNEKPEWQQGLKQLTKIATENEGVCIMCSEQDYHDCHRYYWISRDLENILEIYHINKMGDLEPHPKEEKKVEQIWLLV